MRPSPTRRGLLRLLSGAALVLLPCPARPAPDEPIRDQLRFPFTQPLRPWRRIRRLGRGVIVSAMPSWAVSGWRSGGVFSGSSVCSQDAGVGVGRALRSPRIIATTCLQLVSTGQVHSL